MIDETRYGLGVVVAAGFDEVLARTEAALQAEGFGVLTRIDVRETLKKKLDRDFRRYVILGACNPQLADRALHAEIEIGLLLPCNVIVYEQGPGETKVAAMAPIPALGLVGPNEAMEAVGRDADGRLRRALASLATA
ncbi:MAG TPA: DUF302 domain-containing protein [Gemmatimonadales bacterium]|nr:DUF302 domain-containing protein [Gemmatimonadales bacterium]